MRRRVVMMIMMMALARAMNASMTRVRFSVQMWSLRKPRLCQEFVRSTTQRAPACSGVPFVLITKSQPRPVRSSRVLPES